MKDTRKIIIKKAMELFQKNGYNNTSVLDICKECGITKGTFYYHFPNKDELVFEFYEEVIDDFNDFKLIDTIMLSNAKEQLWKVYEYTIDRSMAITPSVLYAIMISDIQNGFDLFSPYLNYTQNNNTGKLNRLMLNLVKKGQVEGTIKQGDPEMMICTYVAALIGISLAWSRSGGVFDEKEDLKKAFDIIF